LNCIRDAKVQGLILFELTVLKDGNVTNIKIIRGLGHGLDESAIRTISTQWRFKPGMLKGQPVAVRANAEVAFRLN
jgi:protein TonB